MCSATPPLFPAFVTSPVWWQHGYDDYDLTYVDDREDDALKKYLKKKIKGHGGFIIEVRAVRVRVRACVCVGGGVLGQPVTNGFDLTGK